MWFTLVMLGVPLVWVVFLTAFFRVNGDMADAWVLVAPAALWLWADMYLVPLYWAVRVIRYSWFHRAGSSATN